MLDLAFKYRDELQRKYQEVLFTDRMRFFSLGTEVGYTLPIEEHCGEKIQMVSIDAFTHQVIGYLSISINRITQTGYGYEAINFYPGNNIFREDIAQFDIDLFTKFGLEKILWNVVVGNPAEKLYDSFTECGARIIGIFSKDTMLSDGQLYDVKYYEILKQDFLEAVQNKGLNPVNYRMKGGNES